MEVAARVTDLKKRTITAVKWVGLLQLVGQLVSFSVSIILARILFPSDYGLVAMSSIVTGFAMSLSGLGISSSIIQKKDIDSDHLTSAFWGGIAFGTLMFLLADCMSILAAKFYDEPKLISIIIVSAISFVLTPFMQVHASLLQKELRFKEISLISFGSLMLTSLISISMALYGFGVWSLVVGSLLVSPIQLIFYWNRVKWRPQFRFKWGKLKELLRFGIFISSQSLLNFATANYDYLIIGKFGGAHALGVYSMAREFITKPLTQISPIITSVLFPAFSQIQDHNDKIRKGYLKGTTILATLTFPIMAGVYLVADQFILVFYGDKWAQVIPIIKILCVVGALKSIGTMVGSIQNAKSRPDIGLKWNIFTLVLYVPSFSFAAYYWGAAGVAWTLLVLSVPLFVIIQMITNDLIELKLKDYISSLAYPTMLSLGMILIVSLFKIPILSYTNELYVSLILMVVIGASAYTLLMLLFNRSLVSELKAFLK